MPANKQPVYTGIGNAQPALSEELFKATEAIYRQNFELSVKNRTLRVLRSLYTVSLKDENIAETAQHITDILCDEMSYQFALLSVVQTENQTVGAVAINQNRVLKEILKSHHLAVQDTIFSLKNQEAVMVQVLAANTPQTLTSLFPLFSPFLPENACVQIEHSLDIRTLFVYPLVYAGRPLGVLAIGIGNDSEQFSDVEKESMVQLIDVVKITLERSNLQRSLQEANNRMKDLDKLKDEFVTLASHELRTPMTAIRGSLSTILEGYAGEISPSVREFLVAAYNENDRLIRLVNNLLNISRIEAGRINFAMTKVDISAVIQEVVSNLDSAAKEKNLTLIYDKKSDVGHVRADCDKVKEVLINIVGNAVKFTHKGGVTVRAAVDGNFIVISITDTGSGISNSDQELLFKKFSQVQGNYAKQSGGTGLGLYICKIMVEGMGGKIWLDSTLGVGSTFHFTLPIFHEGKV